MSYNSSIPVITDPILKSQRQIKSNFQQIALAFATNHSTLTGNQEFMGRHTVLTMRPKLSDPTTNIDQIAIYQKIVSSVPELFYRPSNDQTPIQLTYPSIRTGLQSTNPDVYFPTQYSFMAGPFVIYGGIVNNPTNGQTVTLTPTSTLIFVDLIVANLKNRPKFYPPYAAPTNISGSSFNISYAVSTSAFPAIQQDVYYLAVGV